MLFNIVYLFNLNGKVILNIKMVIRLYNYFELLDKFIFYCYGNIFRY